MSRYLKKLLLNAYGGIAQTVLNFTTNKQINVGFKDYDTLIFNGVVQSICNNFWKFNFNSSFYTIL